MGTKSQVTVRIANGAALSNAVNLANVGRVVAIQMPAAWTAAGLSFSASADGSTYGPDIVNDAGTAATVTATADDYIALAQTQRDLVNAAKFLKVRSGTSGAPVNQAADRDIILVTETDW